MTQPGQCAFVDQERNTQIALWQKLVALKQCKSIICDDFDSLYHPTVVLLNIFCYPFSSPAKPDDPKLTDWKTPDPDVFTTNSSKLGWCNVDPEDAYSSKVNYKQECDCKYDGLWGGFCETHVECSCVNQCSGHGHCRGGFCQVCLMQIISVKTMKIL